MAASAQEIELKLTFSPTALRKLGAHPLVKGDARAVTRKLHTVYYDTPSLDLWRRGVSLRMRRIGRRWLQTVKGGGSVNGGPHERTEIESEISGSQPDLARLRGGDLAGVFASPQVRGQLRPVFITDVSRSSRMLDLGRGTTVEASIDSGGIHGGGRSETVNELELELKSGQPSRLYDLALDLLKDVPLSVENRSKAERGFALARGEAPAPVKSRPPVLASGMDVEAAFTAVVRSALAQLQANERGMLAGEDPEYLHQMRVALRRLRSAVSVFAPVLPADMVAPVTAELKWLGAALGPARDWDVFLTQTLPPVHAEFGEHPALAAFNQRCAALRRNAGRRAHRHVASQRYQRLALTLAARCTAARWSEGLDEAGRARLAAPVVEFAGTVLGRRYDRVRKRGRRLTSLSPAELHRLRIAIKKFRYATDFFAGLYEGKPARETLKRLARLQDILGAINDEATAGTLVGEVLRGATGRQSAEARGILLGWSRGRAATLRRELEVAWKAFRAAEKFW